MKLVIFLACIVLLARASPTNDGAPLLFDLFPLDYNSPIADHFWTTFDDSFVFGADNALDEPPSFPTLDLFSWSNEFHRPSETFDRDREPMDFDNNASADSELQKAENSFWNDIMAINFECISDLMTGANILVDDQVAHSDQHIGIGPSSLHIEEEKLQDNDHESDLPDQATENVQFIPETSRYGRIYSRRKNNVSSRNYHESSPELMEKRKTRQKQSNKEIRALKRGLLDADYSDQHLEAGPSTHYIEEEQLQANDHESDLPDQASDDELIIPESNKNERILSKTKRALFLRNYYQNHPQAKKRRNDLQKECYKKKCDLKRTLIEAKLSDQHFDGEQAPEWKAGGGRILSQKKATTRNRLYLKEHPEAHKQYKFVAKKRYRRKRAIALLETRTLRPELKDRRGEFIEEYVDCSDTSNVKSKWFLEDI